MVDDERSWYTLLFDLIFQYKYEYVSKLVKCRKFNKFFKEMKIRSVDIR